MKRFIFIILSLTLLLGMGTGCAKKTESQIIGTWHLVETNPHWADDVTWTFYSGGKFEVYSDVIVGEGNAQSGEYSIFTRSLVTPYLKIKGMGDKSLNGIWRVEKCNSKKLVINRVEWLNGETAGAFLRREFTK